VAKVQLINTWLSIHIKERSQFLWSSKSKKIKMKMTMS
jgi:hypothetical protein